MKAVSYTHLDVYKRQLQALVKAGEDGLVVLEAVLEVLVDVEDDLVLVEVVGVVEGCLLYTSSACGRSRRVS